MAAALYAAFWLVPPRGEGVKKFKATDEHGFARIIREDLSVPIRVDPWPKAISSQLLCPRHIRRPNAVRPYDNRHTPTG
jgi:hypothetical protein